MKKLIAFLLLTAVSFGHAPPVASVGVNVTAPVYTNALIVVNGDDSTKDAAAGWDKLDIDWHLASCTEGSFSPDETVDPWNGTDNSSTQVLSAVVNVEGGTLWRPAIKVHTDTPDNDFDCVTDGILVISQFHFNTSGSQHRTKNGGKQR